MCPTIFYLGLFQLISYLFYSILLVSLHASRALAHCNTFVFGYWIVWEVLWHCQTSKSDRFWDEDLNFNNEESALAAQNRGALKMYDWSRYEIRSLEESRSLFKFWVVCKKTHSQAQPGQAIFIGAIHNPNTCVTSIGALNAAFQLISLLEDSSFYTRKLTYHLHQEWTLLGNAVATCDQHRHYHQTHQNFLFLFNNRRLWMRIS